MPSNSSAGDIWYSRCHGKADIWFVVSNAVSAPASIYPARLDYCDIKYFLWGDSVGRRLRAVWTRLNVSWRKGGGWSIWICEDVYVWAIYLRIMLCELCLSNYFLKRGSSNTEKDTWHISMFLGPRSFTYPYYSPDAFFALTRHLGRVWPAN